MIIFSYVALALILVAAVFRIGDMIIFFRTAKKYDNKVKLKKASCKRELSHLIMVACWVFICVSRYFSYVDAHSYYTKYLKNYDGHYAGIAKVNMLLSITFAIMLLLDISWFIFGRYSFITSDGIIRSENVFFGNKIFIKKEKFTCTVENSELNVYIGKNNTPTKYIILDNKGTSDILDTYDKFTFDKLDNILNESSIDL